MTEVCLKEFKVLTVGIKTFCRPKALRETLVNISKYKNFPFRILIADDSTDYYKEKNKCVVSEINTDQIDIHIIDLEFDSGLSRGRNEIVKNTMTDYLMILDDSRYFKNDLPISKMLYFLRNSKYNLIFGKIDNRPCGGRHYTCLFEKIENNQIVCKALRKINSEIFDEVYETNLGLNVFIAETTTLKKTMWREELKLGEHELFFIDYYRKGYRCAFSPNISFKEVKEKNKIYEDGYNRYRERFTMGQMINIKFK